MYTFESRIRYSETDSDGKLAMASLINYFQDCSTFQSEDLGMGVEFLRKEHLVWLMSSWQIVVERFPRLGERVTVGTLPYDMKGFLGYRNFIMLDEAGNGIAKANSLWSLLDTAAGKPRAVPQNILEAYRLEDRLEMAYAPRKIVIPANGEAREPLVVRKHHLDTNHHVNNQQFIQMAMEYLPDAFPIKQVRAEYKKQAFLDDVLLPTVAEEDGRTVVALGDETGKLRTIVEFASEPWQALS